MWSRGALTVGDVVPGGCYMCRGCKISLSAMQTSIRQKRPNFKIPYFRLSQCRPLQSAARGACPLGPPLPAVTGFLLVLVRLIRASNTMSKYFFFFFFLVITETLVARYSRTTYTERTENNLISVIILCTEDVGDFHAYLFIIEVHSGCK